MTDLSLVPAPSPSRKARRNETSDDGSAAKLEMFVSYATEDRPLAEVLQDVLQKHLGSDFCQVWIDTQGLRAGFNIGDTIKQQLEQSSVLVIVYTGQQKDSHSFTGAEVGYFMGVHEPLGPANRIISFFLDNPPQPVAEFEGLSYGITPSLLARSIDGYLNSLHLDDRHPIVGFLRDMEVSVDQFRRQARLAPRENELNSRVVTVRALLTKTFNILKERMEGEIYPQRKLIIDVTEELPSDAMNLPDNAIIRDLSPGNSSGFG